MWHKPIAPATIAECLHDLFAMPCNAVTCDTDQIQMLLCIPYSGAVFRLMRGRGTDGGLNALDDPSSCMMKPE